MPNPPSHGRIRHIFQIRDIADYDLILNVLIAFDDMHLAGTEKLTDVAKDCRGLIEEPLHKDLLAGGRVSMAITRVRIRFISRYSFSSIRGMFP